MREAANWLGVGAGLSVIALYPLFLHGAIVTDLHAGTAMALVLVQAAATGLLVGRASRRHRWLALVAAATVVALSWHSTHHGLLAAAALNHAAIYFGLLALFGRTLRPGNEPLVTTMARKIRGSLTEEMLVYTRRVTIAWCLFFAGQLAMSALLFQSASEAAWSFFINILDLPLVATMFLLEYAYRLRRFRNYAHGSIADVVRVFSERAKP
ncbi:hypothetical protein [Azospirillum picis]|uniref:Membrane protein n=1 Tax=Azospirillum picis TaxID=488438 RepID=A0ABU0MR67_9PROT|nr:hypothetical protein [Azospirillum picis]MBP2302026.1 putative membrane protein [Azospirillum picis]MDQ0535683.1 putative membrane protein [Azospirillum picis]